MYSEDLARIFAVHLKTIHKWVKEGALIPSRRGPRRRYVFDTSYIQSLLPSGDVTAPGFRLVTLKQAARIAGKTQQTLIHWEETESSLGLVVRIAPLGVWRYIAAEVHAVAKLPMRSGLSLLSTMAAETGLQLADLRGLVAVGLLPVRERKGSAYELFSYADLRRALLLQYRNRYAAQHN